MHWMSEKFELSRNDGSGNVRPMEGLRGFAVFLVFLVHYTTLMSPFILTTPGIATALESIHSIGNAGVDLFFVLSGYLIYGSLMARRQDFVPFMRRRIARIYPAFLVVLLVYLLLSFLQPATSKIPSGTPQALLYISQNLLLLPGIFKIDPIITVAWSLSYEMLYYIVLPPLILLLKLHARPAAWRVGFFVLAGATILGTCAVYGGPIRLAMFVSGIVLHEALRAKVNAPPPGVVVTLAAASLWLIAAAYHGPLAAASRTLALMVAFFYLCLHCFSLSLSWLTRAFCVAPLRWLGNMSYSYYLIHGLALKAGVMLLMFQAPGLQMNAGVALIALPLVFGLTLLPAAALFLFIERPFSLSKRAAPTAPPVPAPI
jgi:peptidoglycan/LPS O-acetylase OafA/YrhL